MNKHLQRMGPFWQREWFDRVVRNENEKARIIRYIEQNPVKAGLAKEPDLYRGLGPG